MRLDRRSFAAAAAIVLTACSDVPTTVGPADEGAPGTVQSFAVVAGPEDVVPGELLVKMKPGAEVGALLRQHGLALGRQSRPEWLYIVRVAPGRERAEAAALRRDARVQYAEPNYLRQPTSVVDAVALDPRLWAFYNPGGLNMRFTSGRSKGQLLPSTYASTRDADEDNILGYTAGGDDVIVGSLDTGVDWLHSEFTGQLIAGRDWVDNDNNPADADGHGTHTTGTMAGRTVGVAGVAGAAAHVKVYVQRVCGPRGCPTSAIVNGILAAAAQPDLVAMNLSLGGSSESQAEKDAIAQATAKGVLVIASAGNSGKGTVACPACDPNAISVAATDWADRRASYSQYGTGLDIAAPGGSCYSNTTAEGCIYSAYLGGGYAWMQGTSMAAPQVTGTAAVVASVLGLRGAALRERLLATTDDLGAAGYDTQFGRGRLNAYRAVTGAQLSE